MQLKKKMTVKQLVTTNQLVSMIGLKQTHLIRVRGLIEEAEIEIETESEM